MEEKTIKVLDQNGVEKEAEVVLCFEKDKNNYIIYTFNEQDEKGMTILYSSRVRKEKGENLFEQLNDEEWAMVKKVMNQIVVEGRE